MKQLELREWEPPHRTVARLRRKAEHVVERDGPPGVDP